MAAAWAALACAKMEEPPGGPPDVTPPSIIWVRPDSGSVTPGLHDDLVIQFDEIIDEQPGGSGGAPGMGGGGGSGGTISGLASRVLLSPVDGPVKVSWHRSAIGVKPKEGWKPNRVYHLQILPGIADLRRNAMKQGRTVVFTTGPAIPSASISGVAVMWTEQRLLTNGLVRAVLLPDSAAYLTLTDSTGRFHFEQIPPGRYVVMAVVDQNNNRQRDRREPYDSALITVDTSAQDTLWTFIHDTLGPRLQQLDPVDSVAFRMSFSLPLDPYRPFDSLRVRVLTLPDSTPVPLAGVFGSTQYDSVSRRERAVTDSLRQDSLARLAPKDTTHKVDTTRARPPRDTLHRQQPLPPLGLPSGPPQGPPGAGPGGRPYMPDSTVLRVIKQRPVPDDKLVVRIGNGAVLQPGAKYYVEVKDAVNLNGAFATSHNILVIPKAKPVTPADTTKGKKDSTKP